MSCVGAHAPIVTRSKVMLLGRGGARKRCANSWMECHSEREGMRFHVLRVKNRFHPDLDQKLELLNGGYRDINIKLKIGFTEGKNGRAELMTVPARLFSAHVTMLALNHCRWKSGRMMKRTIASCARCR